MFKLKKWYRAFQRKSLKIFKKKSLKFKHNLWNVCGAILRILSIKLNNCGPFDTEMTILGQSVTCLCFRAQCAPLPLPLTTTPMHNAPPIYWKIFTPFSLFWVFLAFPNTISPSIPKCPISYPTWPQLWVLSAKAL